ncbi:Tetracycline resistance protein, class B [Planctomycetes bacterium Poly30]|uniref:Tetracycline resistance protein, class B n=1 Tax=Saltatorellus ferox TaxID=2528018 RepID=A0A518ERE1_9BACT|nr:Tetracycline resistance protein, class B [Planctomycetes bacterium Poly30]
MEPTSPIESSPRKPKVLGLIFLTVFLDMVGFSIIFPLFPKMLEWYVDREGAASAIGRLASWLQGIVNDDFAVIVLFGGILGSLYSGLQFLFAPIWGAVSDKIGRRPTLLFTLLGTALSYVIWFFAGTFALLVIARLVGGLMAGNISTASAAVADTHAGKDRAKGMGVLGAGIGLGFVVGPALGGLASGWDLTDAWASASSMGVNPFSGAATVAFGLAVINLLWAALRFPETKDMRPATAPPEHRRGINPFASLRRLTFPGVHTLNIAYFIYFTAFGAMEFTLVFLAAEHLGYGPRQNAYMFVFIGLTIAFVQGGIVRRLVPKVGERKVAWLGMALTVPGFIGIAAVTRVESAALLYASLALVSVGSSLVMPSFSSLASRYVPDDRQGFALGVFRSFGSLARVLGPLAGGLLYYGFGSYAPYALGAFVLLVPLALSKKLPEPVATPVSTPT